MCNESATPSLVKKMEKKGKKRKKKKKKENTTTRVVVNRVSDHVFDHAPTL
jgi:hypothetical protein